MAILRAKNTQATAVARTQMAGAPISGAVITAAAKEVTRGGLGFGIKTPGTHFVKQGDNTLKLKPNVSPFDGISDLIKNGKKYELGCHAAVVLVYYRAYQNALVSKYGPTQAKRIFDQAVGAIELGPNVHTPKGLKMAAGWTALDDKRVPAPKGAKKITSVVGDWVCFSNPGAKIPWGNENAIRLGNDSYWCHPYSHPNGGGLTAKKIAANLARDSGKPASNVSLLPYVYRMQATV